MTGATGFWSRSGDEAPESSLSWRRGGWGLLSIDIFSAAIPFLKTSWAIVFDTEQRVCKGVSAIASEATAKEGDEQQYKYDDVDVDDCEIDG